MSRFTFYITLLGSLFLLSACSSVDPIDTTLVSGSTDTPAKLAAYCDGGVYRESHTLDYGSARHPFALTLPRGSTCRITITLHPDEPTEHFTTLLAFDNGRDQSTRLSTKNASIDLGAITLPHDPLALIGKNGGHFARHPLTLRLEDTDAALPQEEGQQPLPSTKRD